MLKQKEKVYGEYVLKVSGSTVTYNSYYLSNGGQLVAELQSVFFPLNVEYAKKMKDKRANKQKVVIRSIENAEGYRDKYVYIYKGR